ncbi:MAG: peptidase S10 [Candidatus Kapabacteria bacterium]|jgi:carboxypeptidase C (cathepsin A)|nr:peptidase S10 [Candidatus Kapabacteria bacterium]
MFDYSLLIRYPMPFALLAILFAVIFSSGVHAADSASAKAPVFQQPTSMRQSVSIGGTTVDYTVTAGHMALVKEDGTERAKVFFIAYTRNGVPDASKRPITFSFNGGPGSSSVWLHLGVLGPRRVAMNDDGSPLPPPFALVNNDQSWLDLTDLVFIDPVSTGFSRALDEKDAKQFHGIQQDVESVGEFIHRWMSTNHRWASPKYLIGESYGTTRASALADHLQGRYGMALNGVILVSAVLQFQTLSFDDGNDLPYALFLPSYAATAWYHKRLPSSMQGMPLETVVEQARQFAATTYTTALMKGSRLTGDERTSVRRTLASLTGLSEEYLERSDLRPNIHRLTQELLRAEGKTIGRFDSRYTGIMTQPLSEWQERDPSYVPTILGAYSTCINDYLRRELNVTTTLPYEVLTGKVWPWDYSSFQNEYVSVAPRLKSAMASNPDLRVWVLNGYYDLATPFYATEYTFSHMGLPPALQSNVTMTYYHAGHMMYLLKSELVRMKEDARLYFR